MLLYSISPFRAVRLLRSAPMFLAVAFAIVFSAYVFAAPSTTFAATTYYIAKNGSNSNPCTAAQPCLTITHGITKLKSGDTLIVKGGTYNESVLVDVANGSDAAHTTIKAAPGETVWLRPLSFSSGPDFGIYHKILRLQDGRHHIKIERINLDGSGLPKDGKHSVALLSTGLRTHHLIFDGMEMKHSRGDAIHFGPSAYGNILRNSYIHDVGPSLADNSPAAAIYLRGPKLAEVPIPNATLANTPGNLIENNRFEDVDGPGIGQRGAEVNNTIRGNIFNNISDNALTVGVTSQNTKFYNNIVSNSRVCVQLYQLRVSPTTMIYNNTFYNLTKCFADPPRSGSLNVIQNNIFYRVGSTLGSSAFPASNFFGGPKFVNPAQGNFRLQSSSPAIDAGITLAEVPTDFDCNKRPAGAKYDMGAFEHNSVKDPNCTAGSSGTTTPPPAAPTVCNAITSGSPPTPYGAPYNVLSPQKELLVAVFCEADKTVLTVGNGNQGNPSQNYQGLTYVWHKAYYHQGTEWTETTLSCPATLIANGWCPQKATKDLPTSAAWTVGYTCTWWNGLWKCGCTDASCSTSFWQIQGINR